MRGGEEERVRGEREGGFRIIEGAYRGRICYPTKLRTSLKVNSNKIAHQKSLYLPSISLLLHFIAR